MSQFPLITTTKNLQEVIKLSNEQPVLLFKHSTQCPISANALTELQQFSETVEATDVKIFMVYVIEDRSVSNEITDVFKIKHESPQAFWIDNEKVYWHASHRDITYNALKDAKPIM